MKNKIELSGLWQAAGFDMGFGDWSLPDSLTPSNAVKLEASVPGKIESPGDKQWWYKKTFEIDEDFFKLRTYLELDGIDSPANVFINGEEIGNTADQTAPYRFDVGELVHIGQNMVALCFEPGPRIGILRSAALVSYDAVSISDVHVETEIEGGFANAWITIEAENHSREDQAIVASIVVELGENREKIEVVDTISPFGGIVEAVVRIEEPLLWWPNGFGEATLYSCMVGMRVEGEIMDISETKFGVRDVKLIEQDESGEQRFTFMVNGQDIFCKGANWAPDLGETNSPDIVKLAANANFNMLRVCGGDRYERLEFYQACDELGIMVWHDLSPVTQADQENEEQRRRFFTQTMAMIKRLRAYSSIIAWSGEGVSDILRHLDHYRLFIPTPNFFSNRIHSYPEDFSSLSEVIEVIHTPYALDLGTNRLPSADLVQNWMGEWKTDEQFDAFSSILQGEIFKAQIEHFRREKWSTSGVLFGDFMHTLVNHDGSPKPSYYYAKHAFAPVIVSFKRDNGRAQVFLTSDERINDLSGRLGVGVFSFDSNALDLKSISVTIAANTSSMMWESDPIDELLTDPTKQCLIALFEVNGKILVQNVLFAEQPGNIEFPQPKLLVGREQIDETHHHMDLAGNAYARNISICNLPAQARPSDNYFDMLPGEHYQVIIDNITAEQAGEIVINVWRR